MNRFVIMAASLVVLGISLALPALVIDPPSQNLLGANCFFLGWLSLLMGWPMWLANPMYLLGLIFLGFRKYYVSFGLGVASIGLALCSLSITQIMRDEGGTMEAVTAFGAGFYLWLMSLFIQTMGALILAMLRKKAPG